MTIHKRLKLLEVPTLSTRRKGEGCQHTDTVALLLFFDPFYTSCFLIGLLRVVVGHGDSLGCSCQAKRHVMIAADVLPEGRYSVLWTILKPSA